MLEILNNYAIIHVSGKDVEKLLNSLTTNDIINQVYSYNYSLNNQGRYLFDFFVFRESKNSYYIEIDYQSLDGLISKINMYKLRSEVEITNLSNTHILIYSKMPIDEKLALYSFRDTRYHQLGYRSCLLKNLEANLVGIYQGLYLEDKYQYAIIDGAKDLLYERSIPVEYGAEQLNAINYNKGCYIGQEVISRAKYQGVIRKKIYKLEADQNFNHINTGSDIFDIHNNKIGTFCSGYLDKALAIIRCEHYDALAHKIAFLDNQLQMQILLSPWYE